MKTSFKATENKAFRSFWNDGLLDVMLGLAILALGISWWQDVAAIGAVFPAICVSMWHPLRRRLVEPRMGYVEFCGEREIKVRSFRHGLTAFFAGTMVLGMVIFALWNGGVITRPAEWVAGFPLLLIGIPAVLFAIFTKCKRFALYAVILFLAGVEVVLQGLDPHAGLIASGIVITIAGSVVLARFLLHYPVQPTGTP